MRIAASLLGADFLHLAEETRKAENAGIAILHLDQMDGHFVPNISFGPDTVSAFRSITDRFLDVHLMLSEPMRYIERYAAAGANLITVHYEAENPLESLKLIHKLGLPAGLSIKPATQIEEILPLLPYTELVLVMTVEPGFGGQPIHPDCIAKIAALKDFILREKLPVLLEADGGIKESNAARLAAAGLDIAVMGTGVFRSKDLSKTVSVIENKEAFTPFWLKKPEL